MLRQREIWLQKGSTKEFGGGDETVSLLVATQIYTRVKTPSCATTTTKVFYSIQTLKIKQWGWQLKRYLKQIIAKYYHLIIYLVYIYVRLFSILSYIWNILSKNFKIENISIFSITWKLCTATYSLSLTKLYLWHQSQSCSI